MTTSTSATPASPAIASSSASAPRASQTSTSIAGIFGATVFAGALAVEVGRHWTAWDRELLASREGRHPRHGRGQRGPGKLHPVIFRYKAEHANGLRQLEYGLIAEEVAEIYPELVVRDTDGQPAGVRCYHVLPAMLLNELQRQQRLIQAQQREQAALRSQARLIDGLTARLSRLEAKGAAAATPWHP